MLLLSAHQPLRYCAMGVDAVIVLIELTRGLSFRSSWHHRIVCKRCDHEEKQHGDMAWTGPTITPPRGCLWLPIFNVFEFEDERHVWNAPECADTVGAAAASARDRVVALQARYGDD